MVVVVVLLVNHYNSILFNPVLPEAIIRTTEQVVSPDYMISGSCQCERTITGDSHGHDLMLLLVMITVFNDRYLTGLCVLFGLPQTLPTATLDSFFSLLTDSLSQAYIAALIRA